jgi:hypothetical protein
LPSKTSVAAWVLHERNTRRSMPASALDTREQGKRRRVALTRSRWPLHQQRRHVAVFGDIAAYFRVKQRRTSSSSRVQGVDTGEKAGLPLRGGWAGYTCLCRVLQPLVEGVETTGAHRVDHHRAPVVIPAIGVVVERADVAIPKGDISPAKHEAAIFVLDMGAEVGHPHLDKRRDRRTGRITLDDDVGARGIQQLIGRRGVRHLLISWQSRVDIPGRRQHHSVPNADGGQQQCLVEIAVNISQIEAQAERCWQSDRCGLGGLLFCLGEFLRVRLGGHIRGAELFFQRAALAENARRRQQFGGWSPSR